ncbi:MAG: hypothetical protein C5B47_04990 [Verrucomicrobia bacterium]|nr:MAG: hypothetical protein C5B47_04990 [Verrucomicrobiota bacterium]
MSATLYLSANVEQSFSYVVRWLNQAMRHSAQDKKVVVLPHQEVAIRLRKILATEGGAFINIHFWTPEQLRSRFLQGESRTVGFPQRTIASREELHLILASVAGTFSASDKHVALLVRAVEENPAWLLRALDMLDGAGLQAEMFESLREIRSLVQDFSAMLEEQGLQTFSAADRLLASRKLATQFESLLIFGFHGGHWPLFPLLMAASRQTNHLEVVFDAPQDTSFDLDSSWIGTWETVLNIGTVPLRNSVTHEAASDRLQLYPEGLGEPDVQPCVEFLVEESILDLAQTIALKAAEFIGAGSESVAVVFPGYGSLSREVALALNELEIPHFDAIGHKYLGSSETPLWRRWCAFQKNRTVSQFVKFLAALSDYNDLIELLQVASAETLSQDISICTAFIRRWKKEKRLDAYMLLPESAAFAEFCDLVEKEFHRMSWWEQLECVQVRRKRFQQPGTLFLKRGVFLRWLEAALRNERRRRDPLGSHPYATLQLLRRDQAALCPWTHVILAGMNAGEWPEPTEESGAIPSDIIADFNRQIASANRSSQVEGPFGEGHLTATQLPCLGPYEKSISQKRDFQALCQVPLLVATTWLENDARPSIWFSQLFQQRHGRLPSRQDLRHMVSPKKKREPPWVKIEEVAAMRKARLDPTAPFGAWEFRANLPSPPLAVVDIERLLTEPAKVWMKVFLGVQCPKNQQQFSGTSTVGTWTHRWLRNVCLSGSGHFPDQTIRRQNIFSASEATRIMMEKACGDSGKTVTPRWIFMWRQARSFALQLSDQLEAFRGRFPFVATETSFQNVFVPPLESLIKGRWDLVLYGEERTPDQCGSFAGTSVFLIDYKTGKEPQLASILRDGTGIQLALYAYAALAWGAQRVDAAWLTPYATTQAIQLPFEELEKFQPIFATLGRMLRTGTFGMRGELRSEFAFRSPMPLATFAIPQDILETKWQLTHEFEFTRR